MDERTSYVALKGSFCTPKSGDIGGAFCIIYIGESGKIFEKFIFVARSSGKSNIEVSSNWEEFVHTMHDIGDYDKALTDKISNILPSSFNEKMRLALFADEDKLDEIAGEIRKELEKALHYFVELDARVEIFGQERAEAGGLIRKMTQSEEGASERVDGLRLGQVILACAPQIDPVNGRPASQIACGDRVFVTMDESNEVAKKIVGYMHADGIEPVFPVESVQQLDTGKIAIILRVNPEVQGMMRISSEVKIRVLKGAASRPDEEESVRKKLNTEFIIHLAAICGILAFIAVLIYFIRELI